jgi:hypothetical protein
MDSPSRCQQKARLSVCAFQKALKQDDAGTLLETAHQGLEIRHRVGGWVPGMVAISGLRAGESSKGLSIPGLRNGQTWQEGTWSNAGKAVVAQPNGGYTYVLYYTFTDGTVSGNWDSMVSSAAVRPRSARRFDVLYACTSNLDVDLRRSAICSMWHVAPACRACDRKRRGPRLL